MEKQDTPKTKEPENDDKFMDVVLRSFAMGIRQTVCCGKFDQLPSIIREVYTKNIKIARSSLLYALVSLLETLNQEIKKSSHGKNDIMFLKGLYSHVAALSLVFWEMEDADLARASILSGLEAENYDDEKVDDCSKIGDIISAMIKMYIGSTTEQMKKFLTNLSSKKKSERMPTNAVTIATAFSSFINIICAEYIDSKTLTDDQIKYIQSVCQTHLYMLQGGCINKCTDTALLLIQCAIIQEKTKSDDEQFMAIMKDVFSEADKVTAVKRPNSAATPTLGETNYTPINKTIPPDLKDVPEDQIIDRVLNTDSKVDTLSSKLEGTTI